MSAAHRRVFHGYLPLLPGRSPRRSHQLSVIATDRHALDGRSFGPFGTAEKTSIHATIAVDPNDPHNTVSADIRGSTGMLLLELPNRGRKLLPTLFDNVFEVRAQRCDAKTRAVVDCFAPIVVVLAGSGDGQRRLLDSTRRRARARAYVSSFEIGGRGSWLGGWSGRCPGGAALVL